MDRPRLAGGWPVMSTPSMVMMPPLTSSRPAISRSSVDLPQPDGPTNTTNSPSRMSRSTSLMTGWPAKCLETCRRLMRPMMFSYFTAPNVRPRTSWRCENQPITRIGAMASVDAADSLAQNRPSGLE